MRITARLSTAALGLAALAHCTPGDNLSPPPDTDALAAQVTSPYGTLKWFFPEGGHTVGGYLEYHSFQTYYHFTNPSPVSVTVEAYFQGDAGAWTHWLTLPPQSRTSVPFSSMSGGRTGFHAAELYSATPGREIQVSSTMFNNSFEGYVWESSKAVNGATEARTSWAFGEGGAYGVFAGRPVFDHYYVVYNPNPYAISMTAQHLPDQFDNGGVGAVTDPARTVPARSRLAFNPYTGVAPWPQLHSRGTRVTCSGPCVAQMTMYQVSGVPGRKPNTQSALGSSPATTWYVIGIPTGGSWQNRIYVLNTAAASNPITLTYRNAAGAVLSQTGHTIPPEHRISYDLNSFNPGQPPGLAPAPQGRDGSDLSLEISAPYPIAITKIMYWARDFNWNEGASTTGHAVGGSRVVIPGGNHGGGFHNYVQVMNVGGSGTTVYATNLWPGGNQVTPRRAVGYLNPKGMLQLDASAYLPGTGDFSTILETDGPPIIAESSTFFGWDADEPHLLWRTGDSVEGLIYNAGAGPYQP